MLLILDYLFQIIYFLRIVLTSFLFFFVFYSFFALGSLYESHGLHTDAVKVHPPPIQKNITYVHTNLMYESSVF